MKQKEMTMRQRRIMIREVHEARKEIFIARKEEFYADAEARGQPDFENKKRRIEELDKELERLLETELRTEGGVYKSHVDYQNAISVTIGELNGILNYIHQNSGVTTGLGRLLRSNKGRRPHLPVEAIYNKIKELYSKITIMEREEELNEEQFLLFKEKVENEADRILEQLEAVIGVRGGVRRPRTTRVNRFLVEARKRLQKAPEIAQAGIGGIRSRVAGVGGTVGGAAGAVIGQLPNPIPSLRGWASNVSNLTTSLRDRIRRGNATNEDIAEAEGAAATGPEVENRVNVLFQVAQGIRNFDPGKSARLAGLANRLRELNNGIVNLLKSLRNARTPQEAEEIVAEVQQEAAQAKAVTEEAETELQRAIMELVGTEPTGLKQEWAEAWLEKVMPDIPVEEIARETRAKAKIPEGMKPGVAERTQRSKDTNLKGKSRGRRGFSSDAREPKRTIPRNLRMQPYNRSAAKRDARRQIGEEGY